MTQTQSSPKASAKAYTLQGTLIEACSCRTLCRCWIGEDPDGGACESFLAYHIDKGEINGLDVSGLNYVGVFKIPGNVLAGNWKRVTYVDSRATDQQRAAILDAWHGRLGGPLADLNGLVSEDVAIETVPIEHNTVAGEGTLAVGDKVRATMAPYRSAYGAITTLRDTIFSTIPGAPAYVAKASEHVVNIPEHGMVWTFKDRNAIQGDFLLEA
ncbi:MAG: DUF1326 domain-containing protein [Candidatus Eremiobacteraeota bacterium]|nr:DUF1326 domain-containing protein [Candidatus Eremiobacteraeota bacterium]